MENTEELQNNETEEQNNTQSTEPEAESGEDEGKKVKWYDKRISKLSAQKQEKDAEIARLKQQLSAFNAPQEEEIEISTPGAGGAEKRFSAADIKEAHGYGIIPEQLNDFKVAANKSGMSTSEYSDFVKKSKALLAFENEHIKNRANLYSDLNDKGLNINDFGNKQLLADILSFSDKPVHQRKIFESLAADPESLTDIMEAGPRRQFSKLSSFVNGLGLDAEEKKPGESDDKNAGMSKAPKPTASVKRSGHSSNASLDELPMREYARIRREQMMKK